MMSRLKICILFLFFALLSLFSFAGEIRYKKSSSWPKGASMVADIKSEGRSSWLDGRLDIAISDSVDTEQVYSGDFVKDSEGFRWYLSKHYAVKSDLSKDEVGEALLLLELSWVQLAAIFGEVPFGSSNYRFVITMAKSRYNLSMAMANEDMHVFSLGGITQEGFSTSYIYSGTPYQTRYILIHEAVHLFQYCLTGNTRGAYGFLVEGIADFFSSHVYDPVTKRLTVNVLDRAPIHNHLERGLSELADNKDGPFSTIYLNPSPTRAQSVLLTAFLQSNSNFERCFRKYLKGMNQIDTSSSFERSTKLIKEFYGEMSLLDEKMKEFLSSLYQSFRLLNREFDQEGNTFVSYYPASNARPASLEIAPMLKSGPFIRDWYHGNGDLDEKEFLINVKWRAPPSPTSFSSVVWGDGLLTLSISNAPAYGLSFFEVNGIRDEKLSNRLLNGYLQKGVIFKVSGQETGKSVVKLIYNDKTIGEIPANINFERLRKQRYRLLASEAGIEFGFLSTLYDGLAKRFATGSRFLADENVIQERKNTKADYSVPIDNWEVFGPFETEAAKKFRNGSLRSGSYSFVAASDGTMVGWKKCKFNHTPLVYAPIVNLARTFGRQANSMVAFARTTITVPTRQVVMLRLGVSDRIIIYLNGQQIYSYDNCREWSDGNISIEIPLREGENDLLLKLHHGEGLWLLSGEWGI